jgi:flagellar biosynthesis protein FlhF
MKIKHYQAPDMRQALRQVREAQGPDAVILSSRKITGGVEVVAAVDYDDDGGDIASAQLEQSVRSVPPAHSGEPETQRSRQLRARAVELERREKAAAAAPLQQPRVAPVHNDYLRRATTEATAFETTLDAIEPGANVSEELRNLRRMLETQLATLAWNDLSRRAPVQTELLKQLTTLGLANDLCAELVAQLPARLELSEAHRTALALIARRINVAPERWVDTGGLVAMIGPTGVGKTTLIAKLAARWVMRHGPKELALISCDSTRIGAQEQIHTLGRLLGVPTFGVESSAELPALLDQLSGRRFVLIDTAGMSQRDETLARQLTSLVAANRQLETCLVVSAAAQAGAIEETLQRFSAAAPATCVLTKLDEATSLGGALSALIRSGLPLAYVSDGQRVPEDLNPARAHQLVARAVDLSRKSGATADEDLLQRRFGAVAHALA